MPRHRAPEQSAVFQKLGGQSGVREPIVAIAVDTAPDCQDDRHIRKSREQDRVTHGTCLLTLANLELVTPSRRPEHEVRFDRRATRIGTRKLRYHDGFLVAEIEMRARKRTNALLLGRDTGTFLR